MNKTAICVDLDGSLIYTDTLLESFVAALKQQPWLIFLCFFWCLFKGRAYCKQQLSKRIDVRDLSLPQNQALIHWLQQQKQLGHACFLVTAADQRIADSIKSIIPLFDEAYGSNGTCNLKGKNKRDFLDQRFGKGQYIYVGNSHSDLAIFKHSESAVVISNHPRFISQAKRINTVSKVFSGAQNNLKQFFKALRPHQYTKNLLIFLPFILAPHFYNVHTALINLLGFICFSLMASSVYFLNDLLDLPSDRQHHTKSSRPFASGQLSLAVGLLGAPLGFIASLLISASFLPSAFTAVLATYAISTMAYSFTLKQKLLIDVFTLAILYTLRILAGMAILGAAGYSDWLLLFSFFFFTSLAFIKRYAEIHSSTQRKKTAVHGRAYRSGHLQEVKIFGISSGYLSILVFALYIQSAKSIAMYQMNELLYLVCPLLLYWISRAWIITTEGRMHDDPVVFAIKDRATYAISLCISVIVLAASHWSMP